MGSNLNFKNYGTAPPPEGGGGGWPPGSFPLTRQSSIYSLTFDEFQSTVGGIGKDFGSMNMDELIKNIWSAEENQNIGSSTGGVGGVGGVQEGGGYLQRQGSLTLPRTLSLKTVEEVWRDMSKDASNGGGGDVGFGVPQRQPTLGEVTLEEFLVRAGVVREEPQLGVKPNNAVFFGNLSHSVDNSQVGFGFQQSSNQIPMQTNNLPLNVNGVRSVAQQLATQSPLRQQQPQQQQQQLILPKQTALPYAAPLGISSNGQLSSPRMQNGFVQNAGLGVVGLGANGVSVTSGSPAVSSDGLTRSNGDTSSVSPVPYVFNGTMRGRKSAALEKVVERRQRRMIKNRESAARSRARKQAYTMELEAEVAKLKEENEELQKKQEEMMEMQKNQVLEMMNQQNGAKRRCLRRTQTGPW